MKEINPLIIEGDFYLNKMNGLIYVVCDGRVHVKHPAKDCFHRAMMDLDLFRFARECGVMVPADKEGAL